MAGNATTTDNASSSVQDVGESEDGVCTEIQQSNKELERERLEAEIRMLEEQIAQRKQKEQPNQYLTTTQDNAAAKCFTDENREVGLKKSSEVDPRCSFEEEPPKPESINVGEKKKPIELEEMITSITEEETLQSDSDDGGESFAQETVVSEKQTLTFERPMKQVMKVQGPDQVGETESRYSCTDNTDEREYTWEKPEWVVPKLRSSGKLSSLAGECLIAETEMKSYEWEKPEWVKPKLRSTGKGDEIKKGSDLQAPITHVQKDALGHINFEANPNMLKPTGVGSSIRLGKSLAAPITHVEKNPFAGVNLEVIPDFVLKSTKSGEIVKAGVNLAKPITFPDKQEHRDVNWDAHQALLKRTEKGNMMKEKGNLQAPITHIEKRYDDVNVEAHPFMVLNYSEKGAIVRMGENLALPITDIASVVKKQSDD